MQWVSVHGRQLRFDARQEALPRDTPMGFHDWITPRAVHELLFDPQVGHGVPMFPAMLAACGAVQAEGGRQLAWIDPLGVAYPPAVVAMGVPVQRMVVLRPQPVDLLWALAECLRCAGVGATVAAVDRPLTRVEVRRLQLAAEAGGGMALLLRPMQGRAVPQVYAAATRWRVAPLPGDRAIQRWKIHLLHGHGGQAGHSFLLEKHRATGQAYFLHPPAPLVHPPALSAAS